MFFHDFPFLFSFFCGFIRIKEDFYRYENGRNNDQLEDKNVVSYQTVKPQKHRLLFRNLHLDH